MNKYIGHSSQLSGVEEHRLVGGKGDNMRLYQVTNGKGLFMTVTPDRNGDIYRLIYKGINLGYMSPSGYVAPAYYDNLGSNWLKSFTAGFLTTCGLESVGVPCVDKGEELPLHGSIGNQPCEYSYYEENDKKITLNFLTKDEVIFGRKLELKRKIEVSKEENTFIVTDTIKNTGDKIEPVQILYHLNMGYPLLDEDSVVTIPAKEVIPRDEHAKSDLENCLKMEKPTANYQERCYYHKFNDSKGLAKIHQPKLDIALEIGFDANSLDHFVEWKMMGVRDYVLGLECGNCYPDGRDVMRKEGKLKFVEPEEEITYSFKVKLD